MKIVSKTDVGKMRQTNQDSYAAGELPGGVAWAVVCDGMGGANGGNIASATAVKMISDIISSTYRQGMTANSIRTMLQSAVYSANVSVFDMSKSVAELSGMGTTVVAAVISGDLIQVVHAGDSRAYRVSDAGLQQITKDHSLVQDMIEDGRITPEEAKKHPKKNLITRALGVEESIDVDYNEERFEEGQALLICTDGLTNFVDASEISAILQHKQLQDCPEALVDAANAGGGGDNITVVIIAN